MLVGSLLEGLPFDVVGSLLLEVVGFEVIGFEVVGFEVGLLGRGKLQALKINKVVSRLFQEE